MAGRGKVPAVFPLSVALVSPVSCEAGTALLSTHKRPLWSLAGQGEAQRRARYAPSEHVDNEKRPTGGVAKLLPFSFFSFYFQGLESMLGKSLTRARSQRFVRTLICAEFKPRSHMWGGRAVRRRTHPTANQPPTTPPTFPPSTRAAD